MRIGKHSPIQAPSHSPEGGVGTNALRFSGGVLHAEPASGSVDGVTRGGAERDRSLSRVRLKITAPQEFVRLDVRRVMGRL